MVFFDRIKRHFSPIVFLFIIGFLNLVIFWFVFGFHTNNDTGSYITSILFFRGDVDIAYPNRYLNPLYSIIGANVFRFLSPEMSIICTNILFYFVLVYITYDLFRRVYNERVGFLSALCVMSAYPMLRYALTQVQDIGGYVWYVASIYAAWRWREHMQEWHWLLLSGIAVSFGLLTKESGAMGALFVAVLVLWSPLSWKKKCVATGVSAFFPIVTLCINQIRGGDVGYSSLQWFIDNWIVYAPSNYTFIKWLGVNATTYNLLWLFVAVGVYYTIRYWRTVSPEIKRYYGAVAIPSLSYFAWPLFIGRTVFISAWLFVPLAMYGLDRLSANWQYRRVVLVCSIILIMAVPYVLQYTLRYAHVFQIIEQCQYGVVCSWSTFWQNWHSYSTLL